MLLIVGSTRTCGSDVMDAKAESAQSEQDIQQANAAVNTLDSMKTEILLSAAHVDDLLKSLN